MTYNIALMYEQSPVGGRLVVENATLNSATMMVGWGEFPGENGVFSLDPTSPAHLCVEIDSDMDAAGIPSAVVSIVDTEKPIHVAIRDVLNAPDQTVRLPQAGALIRAEEDVWASL